ncbi:MAG: hypothetical protein J6W60_04445, partial [Treponema sp.]|nr:hypothetical protein [Treponema sp.]
MKRNYTLFNTFEGMNDDYTLVPPPAKFKALKSFLLASFTLFAAVIMASCEFWHQPVREYLETWTMEVAIEKYELFGVESYTDKDGNLCIPSGQDVPVTLFMRNPKHFVLDQSSNIEKPETFPEIQQDAQDTTLLHFTYSSDYLKDFDGSEDNEIGSTLTVIHPKNQTRKEYTFSLKCNSKPPVIDDAAIMTTGSGADQKYVLAIRCPTTDKCDNNGIHRDIVSITINGVTYPVTPASNGELIFGDSLFKRTRPSSLNTINRNFDHSDLAVYFCPDEGASEESKNSKTYTITYTDRAGFTNTRTIDAKLPGMSDPLVYDNDNADSEAATLDESSVNILHIDSTENANYSTVTIKMPTVNDIGLSVAESHPQIYWTLKDTSTGKDVPQNPEVAWPSSTDITLKIPKEGEYTLKVHAEADAHTPSSEKTYRLKLEYAQLPPPVVKKTNGTSLTAGSGSNTNNYIEVGNDNNATVKIYVPTTDVNNNSFLNGNNVNLYYSSAPGSTSAEPTE